MSETQQTPASQWEPKEVNGTVYVPVYTEQYGVPTVYWLTYDDMNTMGEMKDD